MAIKDGGGGTWDASGAVRVLLFSPTGELLLVAGDNKTVQIWSTDNWTCAKTL